MNMKGALPKFLDDIMKEGELTPDLALYRP